MSWSMEWGGRATDFVPDLLKTAGKPGPVAQAAKDALWASVQSIGERDPNAWVRVQGHGWEEADPGLGQFSITVKIMGEPNEINKRLEAQAPADLHATTDPPPAGSVASAAPADEGKQGA